MRRRKWNWVDWMKWNESEWKEMKLELTGGLAASAMVARKPLWEAVSKLRTNWWKPADHIKIMGKEQQQEQEPWGRASCVCSADRQSAATAQGRRGGSEANMAKHEGPCRPRSAAAEVFFSFFFFHKDILLPIFIQLLFIKCLTFAWCQDFNAK